VLKHSRVKPSDRGQDIVAVALANLTARRIVNGLTGKALCSNGSAVQSQFAVRDFSPGDQFLCMSLGGERPPPRSGKWLSLTSSNTRHRMLRLHHEQTAAAPGTAPLICSRWQGPDISGAISAPTRQSSPNYWLVIPPRLLRKQDILALRDAFQKELGISSSALSAAHVADLANSRNGRSRRWRKV